jgi:hypothetical protein
MGHYTRYKEYVQNDFWPWWWSDPCGKCDCFKRGMSLFDNCPDYDDWLKRKPIYNKSLHLTAEKRGK